MRTDGTGGPRPAEVFHIGSYLREELTERGRGAAWLAARCELTPQRVAGILAEASAPLRVGEAEALASVLGISPAMLLNLDRAWHKRHRE
jgi:plasmid maintenance system antidote protein VapI